jgi:hypothetical protein
MERLKARRMVVNGDMSDDLGMTTREYKAYIESMFQKGMSWRNRGTGKTEWTIDHIKPLSSFDLSDSRQCLEAFHYTNTRPVWNKEHREKSKQERRTLAESDE